MDAYDHRRPFHLFINQYSSLFSILYISSILQSLLLVHSSFSMSCQLVVTYIFRVYLRYQPVVVQLKMMQWNEQIIKVNPTAKLGYLQINDITHSHFKSASTYTHHPNISMNHYHKIAIRIETISCIQTHTTNTVWSYSHICSTSHHGLSDLSRMGKCTYFAIVEISCLHSPSGAGLWYIHVFWTECMCLSVVICRWSSLLLSKCCILICVSDGWIKDSNMYCI